MTAYADAHDNESLYDALTYKLPATTGADDRARMQVLAMATAALSQGPSLSQAGSDLLRSKSLDRNSFDSGGWFVIHWDCRDGNGFGRGLPMATDNASKWPYATPLLSTVKVGCPQIEGSSAAYQTWSGSVRPRASSRCPPPGRCSRSSPSRCPARTRRPA